MCAKCFGRNYGLRRHLKTIHEGINVFQCDKCYISFRDSDDLWKHMKVVHEGAQQISIFQNTRF